MPKTLLFLVCLALTGCPVAGGAEPPTPPPTPPPDTNLCGQMCDHLASLGCEESKPVYNSDKPGPVDVPNQTCQDFCQEIQADGVAVNPRCVSLVTACDQIESFRQKDPNACGTSPASSKAP
jgi:hypothetical protein